MGKKEVTFTYQSALCVGQCVAETDSRYYFTSIEVRSSKRFGWNTFEAFPYIVYSGVAWSEDNEVLPSPREIGNQEILFFVAKVDVTTAMDEVEE